MGAAVDAAVARADATVLNAETMLLLFADATISVAIIAYAAAAALSGRSG